MSTFNSLIAGVIAEPDEDTPRLVFCDYLQERDEHHDRYWEQFIRTEVALGHHRRLGAFKPGEAVMTGAEYYTKGLELQKQSTNLWLSYVMFIDYFVVQMIGGATYQTERGFYKSLHCTAKWWINNNDNLIWHPSMDKDCPDNAHPIREVNVSAVGDSSHIHETLHRWKKELGPKYGITININGESSERSRCKMPSFTMVPKSVPNPPVGSVVVECSQLNMMATLQEAELLKVGQLVVMAKSGRVYRRRRRNSTQVALGRVVAVHKPDHVTTDAPY